MTKTRIAFVVETIYGPTAGTEKQLLTLLQGLDRSRFEPTLVYLRTSKFLQELKDVPFGVERLELSSLGSPAFIAQCVAFRRLHRRARFDIVQTFTVDSNYFGTVAARFAGVKRVVSSRRDTGYWQTRTLRALLRVLRRWTPHYLANSQAAALACVRNEGVSPERIEVIPNGIDLRQYDQLPVARGREKRAEWGIADDETLVGAVANLRPVKNLGSLVAAAESICRDFPRVKFVVAGKGSSEADLRAAIARAGLAERFQLVGTQVDILPVLAAFDVGVLCSRAESLSNSLIEYMAAGLPVVASDVGAASEAIEHGRSGILYDPDDPSGLGNAIRRVLTDKTAADGMGRMARETAFARYAKDVCVRRHEEFYDRIMNGNPTG